MNRRRSRARTITRPLEGLTFVSTASVTAMSSPTRAVIPIVDLQQTAPARFAKSLVRVIHTSEGETSDGDRQNQSDRTHPRHARTSCPIR